MKSKSLILSAMLIAMPSALMAQQNIQKAFDALLKQKNVAKISAHHDLEKDPETGAKKAQADVYDFTLPSGSQWRRLVVDIEDAIYKDSENAYSVSSSENNKGINYVTLVVGDGSSKSVAIGKIPGSKYMYACFLDKKDPEKKYRYAYAVEWAEGQDGITGRIATTYGTTQNYREKSDKGKVKIKSFSINGTSLTKDQITEMIGKKIPKFNEDFELELDSVVFAANNSSQWLSHFSTFSSLYSKCLSEHKMTSANIFASNIYNLCKRANVLDADEKKIVISEILRLRDATADEYSKSLLVLSIKRLQE